MSGKRVGAIDRLVADRIRTHRRAMGLSQTVLAEKLGITFQQVQKYEKGTNRVGAGRLFELAGIFQIPINALYPENNKADQPQDDHIQSVKTISRFIASTEGWKLCQAFLKIRDAKRRKALIALAEEMSESN